MGGVGGVLLTSVRGWGGGGGSPSYGLCSVRGELSFVA